MPVSKMKKRMVSQSLALSVLPPGEGSWVVLEMHASPRECVWHRVAETIRYQLPGQAVLNPEFLPGGGGML